MLGPVLMFEDTLPLGDMGLFLLEFLLSWLKSVICGQGIWGQRPGSMASGMLWLFWTPGLVWGLLWR